MYVLPFIFFQFSDPVKEICSFFLLFLISLKIKNSDIVMGTSVNLVKGLICYYEL